jgi:SET domain-containing protein
MIKQTLYLKKTKHKGRAVFTSKRIPANVVIEESPVIVLSSKDREHIDKTLLHDYIFEWGERRVKCAMALGYVPMYNHSHQNNCEYIMDYDTEMIQIRSLRSIGKDEELTINYNGDRDGEADLWFTVKS